MNLNPMEIAIHIINIIVLFVLLRVILYKPVHKFMTGRAQRIAAQLDDAAKKDADAQQLKAQYDSLMVDSEKTANDKSMVILSRANADATNLVNKAREDAAAVVVGARRQAELDKEKLLGGMRGEIGELSVDIAGKILAREVTENDNRRIIDSFFENRERSI